MNDIMAHVSETALTPSARSSPCRDASSFCSEPQQKALPSLYAGELFR